MVYDDDEPRDDDGNLINMHYHSEDSDPYGYRQDRNFMLDWYRANPALAPAPALALDPALASGSDTEPQLHLHLDEYEPSLTTSNWESLAAVDEQQRVHIDLRRANDWLAAPAPAPPLVPALAPTLDPVPALQEESDSDTESDSEPEPDF
jgi:hypothetical protein